MSHTSQAAAFETGNEFSYSLDAGVTDFDLPIPLSLTTPFSLLVPDNAFRNSSSFQFLRREGGANVEFVSGNLRHATLTVTEVTDTPSPVPLPAGFGLMLAGLAALGAIKAHRRRA